MKNVWGFIKIVIMAIGGWLGWFFGGSDSFLYALLSFIVLDYITGVMLAIIEKRLSSDIGAKGIFKKVLIFALVAVGHIVDVNIIGEGSAIRTAVIFFYLSNEGISILENSSKLGLPIPDKLRSILSQLRQDGGKS